MNLDAGVAASPAAHSVLAGGGELGERMRALDWAQTPLGPVEQWPQALKTAVRIMLTSRQPMFVWWGDELVNLYNDAYRAVLGVKHPHALGQPAAQVWHEIWDQVGPRAHAALDGTEGTYDESLLLIMERHGYPEETYFTFSYSPVPNDEGGVGGIFCANIDDTQRILSQRQLGLLRELAAVTADARTIPDACTRAALGLGSNPHDLPFALLYLVEPDERRAVLAGTARIGAGHPAAPAIVPLDEAGETMPWPIAEVLQAGRAVHLTDLGERCTGLPTGAWDRPPQEAVALPITSSVRSVPDAVLIAGLNPYRRYDDLYQGFLSLVGGQIAAAMSSAQAYEDERQRAEALAELDRAKTIFFSNVSHEFRTPLTLLLGPIEDGLGDTDHPLPLPQRERLEVARRNARRLFRLVNTLLDFSRIEAGRVQATYEPIDLPSLTADLASTFRSAIERADLTLVVECPPLPDGVTVHVDREMWEKIVLNLLSNAFKFTFEGEIAVSLRTSDAHAELIVRDTGTGIAAEELPHLFERFHRVEGARGRTYEGSGIGLALVRELVLLHGGSIDVTSQIGRGTTFTVAIPLGAAHLPAERVASRSAEDGPVSREMGGIMTATPFVEEALQWLPADRATADGDGSLLESELADLLSADLGERWLDAAGGDGNHSVDRPEHRSAAVPADLQPNGRRIGRARILLADDNSDMRTYVARLLRQRYDVEAVADGLEALHAARANPPDLVLSDVMMPRMDGFELIAALRADAATRAIPILLLSARAGEESRIEGLQGGADDYLTKPFSARELLARVETQVQLARLRSEAVQRERAVRTQLEWLFEQAPAAIALLEGPDHVFTLANSGYRAMAAGRDVLGKPIRAALPELEGQGIFELLHKVYTTGEPHIGNAVAVQIARRGADALPDDLSAPTPDALETVYFNFVYAPLYGSDGTIEGIFVHAYEVTDQVLARHVAEEAARARDVFLSIASHELRNPVAGLKGTAQLLRRSQRAGRLDAERLERYLSAMESGAARLATLTEDLLDVSRLQRGELPLRLRETDLAALVRETIRRQPRDTEQTVTLQLSADLPVLLLDPDRIEQIVSNLLDNAAKYSPEHAEVSVTIDRDEGAVRLCVTDQGIGLPPGSAETIFQPFGRAPNAAAANIPGLGLGLYISRQIAEQHSGRLWAESSGEGQGTRFILMLPHQDGVVEDGGRG